MKNKKIISSVIAAALTITTTTLPVSLSSYALPAELYLTSVHGDTAFSLGDVNNDSVVDANDASIVIAEYSAISVGESSTLSDIQKKAADTDKNGEIDASDATSILAYYSYVATGGKDSLDLYMETLNGGTATTTTTATTSTVSTSSVNVPATSTTSITSSDGSTASTSSATLTTSSDGSTASTSSVTYTTETTTTLSPDRVSEIRLNQTVCNINVGESCWAAIVTMLPSTAKNIGEIWTSSDESVAITNQEGWIKGMKEGTCIITVVSADNPEVSAQVTVNVIDTSSVKEIRLSRKTATIQTGYSELAANAEIFPSNAVNKSVKWTSSDDSIASVDNVGWITPHKAGTCIITVKSEANPAVYDMVLITVTDDVVASGTSTTTTVSGTSTETTTTTISETSTATSSETTTTTASVTSTATSETTTTTTVTTTANKITDIELSKYEMTIPVGYSDISMVSMLPDYVENKEEIWISSDESIATVNKYGWVKGISTGECTVTVYSVSNPAVYAEIAVKIVDPENATEPTRVNFSYVLDSLSNDKCLALYTPFPEKASGKYEIEYVITDENGNTKTEKSAVLFLPDMDSVTTRLTADTNRFTVTTYLTNLETNGRARIGEYYFSLSPRDAKTMIEDIYYAFYILDGLSE